MARISFSAGESILGAVIAIALLAALLVAAIVYGWTHHQNKINGTDGSTPSSEVHPVIEFTISQA